jgi:putative CocE/NonD family hydrolase
VPRLAVVNGEGLGVRAPGVIADRPASEAAYGVAEWFDVRIPVRDGIELSANLWLPASPPSPGTIADEPAPERFPAILEMIPYGKDTWRFNEDASRGAYLASRGYVLCRVDVRGTGSSQGVALDEYTEDETRDGYDAVEWIAAQPWCSGAVGMWGISYGGFTAIQVAALRPPHLRAIVPMYATDDRYTDDVHYVGGCPTISELAQYAVSQVGMNAMPPRPAYWQRDSLDRGMADWRERWRERLDATPPWPLEWLRQQTDGPYWRRGSLAPDYGAVEAAIFHIAGWMDGYTDAAVRMLERCSAPTKVLIGNWVHAFPHDAYPGPNLDWLYEMARFFDHWLKGVDNGVTDEPPLVWFHRTYTAPAPFPAAMAGQWRASAAPPSLLTNPVELPLAQHGGLLDLPGSDPRPPGAGTEVAGIVVSDLLRYRPTLGTRAGATWGGGWPPAGLARDLRPDEALSLTYTTQPLAEHIDVLGFPEAVLHIRSSARRGALVVRLTDVAPDGTSSLVAQGVLNLTHRRSHADPEPVPTGEPIEIRVPLTATGYRFLAGQRIRLSIAGGYWPVLWPSPDPAEYEILRGAGFPSRLVLPCIGDAQAAEVSKVVAATVPAFKTTPPDLELVGAGSEDPAVWHVTEDVVAGTSTVVIGDGGATILRDGSRLYSAERLEATARDADPADVSFHSDVVYRLDQDGHHVEITAVQRQSSTAEAFDIEIDLTVELDGEPFFDRQWRESIPRDLC